MLNIVQTKLNSKTHHLMFSLITLQKISSVYIIGSTIINGNLLLSIHSRESMIVMNTNLAISKVATYYLQKSYNM